MTHTVNAAGQDTGAPIRKGTVIQSGGQHFRVVDVEQRVSRDGGNGVRVGLEATYLVRCHFQVLVFGLKNAQTMYRGRVHIWQNKRSNRCPLLRF
jgi:hypothetical protein